MQNDGNAGGSPMMPHHRTLRRLIFGLFVAVLVAYARPGVAAVHSTMEFAPEDDWTKPQERPFRASVCLNGLWQFAPLDVPPGPHTTGQAPPLPPPPTDGWSKTPIKIPSPWNVNVWGPGRNVGVGTEHPYWPDSVFYPSYPKEWDAMRMGWLRRSFTVDPAWNGRSILLHFEAVGGFCRVMVNGHVVAEHFDTWLPFEADVTPYLNWDKPNRLDVGVRASSLFAQTDPRSDKFRNPFPNGSNTEGVTGIWQDVYLTRPRLAAFSVSETSWFGIEQLPLGYAGPTRLPGLADGVFFDAPYRDGKPGIQLERMPPYCTTFNPGYDPSLPLYKPLPMFAAMKAALAQPWPKPCPWDHARPVTASTQPAVAMATKVAFLGRADSAVRKWLDAVQVERDTPDHAGLLIIDASSLLPNNQQKVRQAIAKLQGHHGTVLWMLADAKTDVTLINSMLPADVRLTPRTATAMTVANADPLVTGFTPPTLYFAEQDGPAKTVLRCGLDGPLVKRGKLLLTARDTDWSQFNDQPEFAKCAAVLIYERIAKSSGVALLRAQQAGGTTLVCTVDYAIETPAMAAFWKHLLANLGVRTSDLADAAGRANAPHDLLLDGPLN